MTVNAAVIVGLWRHRVFELKTHRSLNPLKVALNLDVTDIHTLINKFSTSPVKNADDQDCGAVTRTP